MSNCERCRNGGPCPACPKPTPEELRTALERLKEQPPK